jgi:benzoyl-CoA reductase/2-hydroxyglutaryl-CoA dehydratase subunit BcrC/BadD/HgdB
MAEQRPKTVKSKKGLEAARKIWQLTKAYKSEMEEHRKKGGLIAWSGGFLITEVLYAFDILPQQVDNMAAGLAAKQVSEDFILRAEQQGFPRDFCTYYKTLYGYLDVDIKDYPQIEAVAWPKPDIMVGGLQVCITHPRGALSLGKRLNIPTFVMDLPKPSPLLDRHDDCVLAPYEHPDIGSFYRHEIEDHYMAYDVPQLKKLIEFLEGVTGRKLDWGKLKECIRLSKRLSQFFLELQDLRRSVPCPVGPADIMSLMSTGFVWAGSERGIDIMAEAVKEARDLVAQGKGAVTGEKFRLFFEGIPPWYTLGFFNYLQDTYQATSVIETYPIEFSYPDLDPDYPLESLAQKRFRYIYSYSARERADLTLRLMRNYKCDGYLQWNSLCCKVLTHFASYMKERTEKELGIPGIILDADQADPRDYHDEIIKGRVAAFFELLESRKKSQNGR